MPGFVDTSIQYWDSSAMLALMYQEPHTPVAIKAHEASQQSYSWAWLKMEVHGGLRRRGATPAQFGDFHRYLSVYTLVNIDPDPSANDYTAIRKILDTHKLRAADAGHLFCLLRIKRKHPDVTFVCFDKELVRAAKKEGVRVFGEN
jgi:predicted nucleic acid-binding protein